mmetsp:Transcript_72456/g.170411  ORF Transcript_72456/g.170411 Transcript_72456/m.170411 type:complete len:222 (+) Transcript_72456:135-800(+)
MTQLITCLQRVQGTIHGINTATQQGGLFAKAKKFLNASKVRQKLAKLKSDVTQCQMNLHTVLLTADFLADTGRTASGPSPKTREALRSAAAKHLTGYCNGQWFFRGDDGWVPYSDEDSGQLEDAWLQGVGCVSLRILHSQYRVFLDCTKRQVNLTTQGIRRVRRFEQAKTKTLWLYEAGDNESKQWCLYSDSESMVHPFGCTAWPHASPNSSSPIALHLIN